MTLKLLPVRDQYIDGHCLDAIRCRNRFLMVAALANDQIWNASIPTVYALLSRGICLQANGPSMVPRRRQTLE